MNTALATGVWYSTNYGINWSSATITGAGTPTWTFCQISDNGQYCTVVASSGAVYQTVIRAPTLYTSGGAIIAGNVGIGTTNPGAILHITNSAVATTYTNKVTMAVSDGVADPTTTYGMINLTRQSDVTDNKGHIAFIRNGNTVQSMGYLQGYNTFGWVANGNMNTSSGIFMASTGNVGIGTTNPGRKLHVSGGQGLFVGNPSLDNNPNGVVGQNSINAYFGSTGSGYAGGIVMYDITSTANAGFPGTKNIISRLVDLTYIGYISFGSVSDDRGIGFGSNFGTITNPNSTTEKMCILSNGNVGIGTTNPSSRLHVNGDIRIGTSAGTNLDASGTGFTINALGAGNAFINIQAGLSSGAIGFFNGVGGIQQRICYMASQLDLGPVYCSSAGGQLQSTNPSDITLKRNVHSMTDNLSILSKLRPVSFNWIDTLLYNSKINYGFIAQEIQEVIPDIVSSYIDTSGNSKYGFDTISIIPFLVGAIKEQHVIIQQQASTITSLESRLTSLEQRLINAGIA